MGPYDDDVYEFGPFRFDVAEKLLSEDGTTVPLEPTQIQALTVLVHAAGHLVTREDLTLAVWKETYVDEGSLTVTISMLRKRLGDIPSQPRYIETVRKSGYRFVAPVTRQSRHAGGQKPAKPSLSQPLQPPTIASHHRVRGRLSVAFMVALIAVIAGWYWSRSGVIRDLTPAPVPLYPFGGIQDDPSFSPDGGQIAFTWRPPPSDNDDIYVVRIGDLEATRLTSHPAWDKSPAWSPDGRQIAFIRRTGGTGEILLISPTGGPEHKVVDTEGTSVAWSPDSQTLARRLKWPGLDR
jgi:DNA-binding winged helix-turn-helix (wHTH) protein